jgi:hypothetical protein
VYREQERKRMRENMEIEIQNNSKKWSSIINEELPPIVARAPLQRIPLSRFLPPLPMRELARSKHA